MTDGRPAVSDEAVQIRWARARQRPLLPPGPRGWLVAVEGPIGVGKSTVARRLADHFRSGLLLEVVEENPFLKDFYRNIRARAFPTQVFFLLSRHRQQQSIAGRLAVGEDIMADYMFAKDRLFAGLTLDDAELALYEAVYTLIAPQVPKPDAIVCLRAPLASLLQRIAERRRAFERGLTPAYLSRLIAAYDAFFEGVVDTPVITVDAERVDPRRDRDLTAIARALTTVRRAESAGEETGR